MTNLLAGISYNQSIQVKTPDKAASFTLGYELHCEGFMSKLQKIDVVVE